MKILNLYSGIGGNRKLWSGCHVTAIEKDRSIARAYQELFPNDTVLCCDAHDFLIGNFDGFDFIWSSPPCPTHSRANMSLQGYDIYRFPDMRLYEEIIFLSHFCKCKWVVENVIGYYDPLVSPTATIDRHYYWSNFGITKIEIERCYNVNRATKEALSERQNIVLPDWIKDKRKLLRNAVLPEIGLHIFNEMQRTSCAQDTAQNIVEICHTAPNSASPKAAQISMELEL
jgi:DNA (cytosine-5)-methyltransferase 1